MKTWVKGGLVGLVIGIIIIATSLLGVIGSLDLDLWNSIAKAIPLLVLLLIAFFLFGAVLAWFIERLNKIGRKHVKK